MRTRIVNRSINPLLHTLPAWVESFRPEQIQAIDEIVRAFQDVNVVVYDGPPGSGKTLVAECVRRLLQVPTLYVCHSKALQDQFARDFPYAAVLKGRSNYATENSPDRFTPGELGSVSCDDCEWRPDVHPSCKWCRRKVTCPYEKAKRTALHSPLALLNSAYFLTEANHIERFSGRGLVVLDEADLIEKALSSFVSVEISNRRMKSFGWREPKVTVEESWVGFLRQATVDLHKELRRLENQDLDVKTNREFKSLANIHQRLSTILASLETENGTPWVYTGRDGSPSWKPTVVDQLGDSLLWRHGQKWLLMSGTVVSAESLTEGLGLSVPYRVVSSPCTFPVVNRQVVVNPVANMAYQQQRKDWGILADNVASVIARHPGENVLVHTVSYDLTAYLHDRLGRNGVQTITYNTARDSDKALARYRLGGGVVLLAPSMDRGIDLPGDACKVQVIAKVPFPSLADRQTKARLYGTGQRGQTWYIVETVRTIVQMSMRAVRHKEDKATTYILDSQFSQGVWYRGRNLFPSWWRDAVRWER